MEDRLIRLPEVVRLCGLSPSTVRRLEAQGSFPRRLRVSTNIVAWRWQEVSAWLDSRVATSVAKLTGTN